MKRWFRNTPDPGQELERRLAELEALAAEASNGYEAQYWIQAGDLCARRDEPKRALGYFGRALNSYLETGRFSAADALCRRMLAAAPDAVRVRSTLMWLTAVRGSAAETLAAVEEYVHAGTARGDDPLVVHQLRLLAGTGLDAEVREALAGALLELGAEREADRLFGEVFAERNGLAASAPGLSEDEWAERMLQAMLLRPEEMLEPAA